MLGTNEEVKGKHVGVDACQTKKHSTLFKFQGKINIQKILF